MMNDGSLIVSPRSWAEIDDISLRVRKTFLSDNDRSFPVTGFVELLDRLAMLELEIVDNSEMPLMEGCVPIDGAATPRMLIRNDVYESACQGKGRARFTIAHELGHLFLHVYDRQSYALARASHDAQSVKAYCASEPQADQFAAGLLIPVGGVFYGDTVTDLMKRFCVSKTAAERRLKYLSNKGLLAVRS